MKKIVVISAFLLLFIFALSGCVITINQGPSSEETKAGSAAQTEPVNTVAQSTAKETEADVTEASETKAAETEKTYEEIQIAYAQSPIRETVRFYELFNEERYEGFADANKTIESEQGYLCAAFYDDYNTPATLSEYSKEYLADNLAAYLADADFYKLCDSVDCINGTLYAALKGKQTNTYLWDDKNDIVKISQNGDHAVFEKKLYHSTSVMGDDYEYVAFTFEVENTADGLRVCGGTFVDNILLKSSN